MASLGARLELGVAEAGYLAGSVECASLAELVLPLRRLRKRGEVSMLVAAAGEALEGEGML